MSKAAGKEIWFTTTAKGSRRAWFFSSAAFRAMPLPLKEAELAIATGASSACTKPEWVGK